MIKIKSPREVLKEVYGFDNFRPKQEDIVNAVLDGKDGLAVLTTGGGKSICYQIPALCCKGTTVVISPLISLMKDQVDALNEKGIQAAFINSSLSAEESIDVFNRLNNNELKLIYIAPERLDDENFISILKEIEIPFFAIDEAHCISTWGHDFRPSYKKISKVLNEISSSKGVRIPRFAYTATATLEIRQDISDQLQLDDPFIYIGDFDRPNIQFNVRESINKLDDISELLLQHRGESTIIYSATIKAGEALAEQLNGMGIKTGMYHGKLDSDTKNKIQESFIKNELQVLVATNAFGMGVDKPDVRVVIHYHMPGNIENYFQEAGRCGRDGKASTAYLLYNERDRGLQEFFIDCTFPSAESIKGVQYFLSAFAHNGPFNIGYEQIAQIAPIELKETQVESILRILEDQEVIKTKNLEISDDHISIDVINPNKELNLDYLVERKKNVIDNLNAIDKFCRTNLCRRRFIMRYFGTKQEHKNCNNCDVCLTQNMAKEHFSATVSQESVKNILKLIDETEQKYEASRLSDVLLGVNNASMQRRGFQNLSSFGTFKNWTKVEILNLFEKLKTESLILSNIRDGNKILLTQKGVNVLDGKSHVTIKANESSSEIVNMRGVIKSPSKSLQKTNTHDIFDMELYTKLSKARGILSKETEMPAFMIFSDQIMKTMASHPPRNKEDLEKIGLPPGKVTLFGDRLIRMINRHIEEEKETGLTR